MLKIYKPTSPGRRNMTSVDVRSLSKFGPLKKLMVIKKSKAGRNNKGNVTVRHQGGGEKRFYRKIDFKQNKFNVPAKVESVEYDPNRSAWIALVCYADGDKRYIIAPEGIKAGHKIMVSDKQIPAETGNRQPLKYMPVGTKIHNIELVPGQGGKIVRSAGSSAVLMALSNGFAKIKLPSGERRLVKEDCLGTCGSISNADWRYVNWGKAGRMRHRGIRPSVRGKAMAPVAHPHGGGEGHSPIGMVHPKTPWGKPALGVKTRKKKKWTNKYIIQRRINKRRKK